MYEYVTKFEKDKNKEIQTKTSHHEAKACDANDFVRTDHQPTKQNFLMSVPAPGKSVMDKIDRRWKSMNEFRNARDCCHSRGMTSQPAKGKRRTCRRQGGFRFQMLPHSSSQLINIQTAAFNPTTAGQQAQGVSQVCTTSYYNSYRRSWLRVLSLRWIL